MGSGLSSDHHHRRGTSSSLRQPPRPASAAAPARVIGADGELREFPSSAPSSVSVSDVICGDDNAARFFVCSSDALYFDADVPALGADELLRPGQIYFVLPAAMRARPLSAADMAALAVRATEALAAASRPRGLARGLGLKKARVVPAHAPTNGLYGGDGEVNEKLNQRTLGGFESTAAAPSPARNAKKPALVARPVIKRALSAIQEVGE